MAANGTDIRGDRPGEVELALPSLEGPSPQKVSRGATALVRVMENTGERLSLPPARLASGRYCLPPLRALLRA